MRKIFDAAMFGVTLAIVLICWPSRIDSEIYPMLAIPALFAHASWAYAWLMRGMPATWYMPDAQGAALWYSAASVGIWTLVAALVSVLVVVIEVLGGPDVQFDLVMWMVAVAALVAVYRVTIPTTYNLVYNIRGATPSVTL